MLGAILAPFRGKGYASKLLWTTFVPLMRLLGPLFFDRRYFQGRHFDKSLQGWFWVWRSIWWQKVLGFNRAVPWPVSPFILIANPKTITFDPDDLNNFQTLGCYFSNAFDSRIVIGKGTYIAPNVGLVTANHNPCDPEEILPPEDIVLGSKCWIGMNAVILPGVSLGDRTVVAAGAVVTKSFSEGNCVIGGVPAKVLKRLDCGESLSAAALCRGEPGEEA